jgi:hypothetical protein
MPIPLPGKVFLKIGTRQTLLDAFDIVYIFIGAVAGALAAFVYWLGHDKIGGLFILFAATGMIVLLMRATRKSTWRMPSD